MSSSATLSRHRADFARILARMHHPILHSFTMSVDVSGTSCIVLVEKDLVAYDYGTVEVMPSTPVKIYNSEDDESYNDGSMGDVGREDGAVLLDVQNPHGKDYESAVDVDSDEEDEVYKDGVTEGLQFCGGSASEGVMAAACVVLPEGENLPAKEEKPAEVTKMIKASVTGEEVEKKSNSNNSGNIQTLEAIKSGEEQKERLQVLIDSGYTLEEIKEWRNKLKAEDICFNGNQILDKYIQNQDKGFTVTGYSFNAQDLIPKSNICWPFKPPNWGPQKLAQLNGVGVCLPSITTQQKGFLDIEKTSASLPASEMRGITDVFVHTSPHQIIRQRASPSATVRLASSPASPSPTCFPLTCSPGPHASVDLVTPAVKNSQNTKSTTKSSQRGRPKGSKNKPQPLPVDFLEPLQGEDGVSTRAQRTWLLGKQLGLKPRGSEALMLRGLEAQIRQNHPHLN